MPSPRYSNPPLVGDLQLVLRFNGNLTNTFSVFVLLVSSSRLAVHENRSVTIEEGLL